MRDRNLHSYEDASNSFPEPGIAVNDAWSNMKTLLDDADGKAPGTLTDNRKPRFRRFGFLSLIACFVAALLMYLFNAGENKKQIVLKKPPFIQVQPDNKRDSLDNKIAAKTNDTENLTGEKSAEQAFLKNKKTVDEAAGPEPGKENSGKPFVNTGRYGDAIKAEAGPTEKINDKKSTVSASLNDQKIAGETVAPQPLKRNSGKSFVDNDRYAKVITAEARTADKIEKKKLTINAALNEKKTTGKTVVPQKPIKNPGKSFVYKDVATEQTLRAVVPQSGTSLKGNIIKGNKNDVVRAGRVAFKPDAATDYRKLLTQNKIKTAGKDISTSTNRSLNSPVKNNAPNLSAKRKGTQPGITKEQDDAYGKGIENNAGDSRNKPALKPKTSFQPNVYSSAVSKKRDVLPASVDAGDIVSNHELFTGIAIDNITARFPLALSNLPADTIETYLKKNTAKVKSGKNKNAPVKNKNRLREFSYGLQWNAPVPLQGLANYFTSATGKSAPYNLLIPGVWGSKAFGKKQQHALQLQFNISTQFSGSNKSVADTAFFSIADSSVVSKSMYLVKTSGYCAGIQYNYAITPKWNAGMGLYYYHSSKALVTQETTKWTTGQLINSSTFGISKSSSNWQYLSNYMLLAKFEFGYQFKKYALGTAVFIPFTNQVTNPGYVTRSINAQLFFKWMIK